MHLFLKSESKVGQSRENDFLFHLLNQVEVVGYQNVLYHINKLGASNMISLEYLGGESNKCSSTDPLLSNLVSKQKDKLQNFKNFILFVVGTGGMVIKLKENKFSHKKKSSSMISPLRLLDY